MLSHEDWAVVCEQYIYGSSVDLYTLPFLFSCNFRLYRAFQQVMGPSIQ